jgi:hypothetical protein
MGDDLVGVIANQFISMPIWVMMGQIVPDGAEGSIFALVSSLQTVGSTVGGSISAILTASLGVSLVTLLSSDKRTCKVADDIAWFAL